MIKVLITIIMLVFATIFLANAATSLIEEKRDNYDRSEFIKKPWVIITGGFCTYIFILVCFMFILDKQETKKEPVKYELIREPIYRQIK